MAEFCTIDDVRGLNTSRTYDSSTEPTDAQVEEFVRAANAQLSAVLQGRGWTQVEDSGFEADFPDAWDTLRQIAAYKAALVAEQAAVSVEGGSEQSGHVRMLFRLRKEMLDELLAVGLPGVSAEVPASPAGAYRDMVAGDDVDERLFTHDEKF